MRKVSAKNTGMAMLAAGVSLFFAPICGVAQSSGTAQAPSAAPAATNQSAPAATAPQPNKCAAYSRRQVLDWWSLCADSGCHRAFTAGYGHAGSSCRNRAASASR